MGQKHTAILTAGILIGCGLALGTALPTAVGQTFRGSVESLSPPERQSALERAFAEAPKADHEQRNIVWAEVDGQRLELDVFWPDSAGPHPVVVWIHGGGFRGGFKELGEYACRTLAANGYVVFNTNYRLSPEHQFPAAVNDCLGAVVWARKHAAEYHGDPDRVAVAGESAGGNLAAMVAWAANHPRFHPTGAEPGDPGPVVNAVIPVYGVFDLSFLSREKPSPLVESYLTSADDLAAASPITYLNAGAPPTLLLVGDADEFYPESVALRDRLQELGVAHEMLVADGADHAFIIWDWDKPNSQLAHKAMLAFLNEHLKNPPPLQASTWTGTWLPDVSPELCGELQCRARQMDDGKWEATFRGYCNRQFLYEVKMQGREQDGHVLFEGQADLGEQEGIYEWTGSIADGVFNGIWKSLNNPGKKGTFVLEPTLPVTAAPE